MKGFLLAFVLIAAAVAGLGFYMGWWSLSSSDADDKVGISLTVDKDRIREDAQEVRQSLGQEGTAEAMEPTGQSKE